MESPGVASGSIKTSPVVPLLSIPLEFLRPQRQKSITALNESTVGLKGIDSNNNKQRGDGEADLLIPSLMSLTVSPPRMTSLHLARLRSRAPFPPPNFCPLYSATFQSSPYIYASSTPSLFLHQRCFAIVEVERTNKTRREFAQVAREVTRENFEPPAGTRILFAYYTYPSGKKVRKTSFISLARFSFFIFVLLFCFFLFTGVGKLKQF